MSFAKPTRRHPQGRMPDSDDVTTLRRSGGRWGCCPAPFGHNPPPLSPARAVAVRRRARIRKCLLRTEGGGAERERRSTMAASMICCRAATAVARRLSGGCPAALSAPATVRAPEGGQGRCFSPLGITELRRPSFSSESRPFLGLKPRGARLGDMMEHLSPDDAHEDSRPRPGRGRRRGPFCAMATPERREPVGYSTHLFHPTFCLAP